MPFEPLVTATIETAINQAIKQDARHQARLSRFSGKVIQIRLTDLPLTQFSPNWVFVFSQRVDVLAQYEGELDCALQLSTKALKQLKDPANLTLLIKQDQLMVQGDINLAQQFADFLTDIIPEPAELLSKFTGDVVAHTLVEGVKQHWQWLNAEFNRQQSHLATVTTEEWQLAPNCYQVDDFYHQIQTLEQDVNDFAQRVERLSKATNW